MVSTPNTNKTNSSMVKISKWKGFLIFDVQKTFDNCRRPNVTDWIKFNACNVNIVYVVGKQMEGWKIAWQKFVSKEIDFKICILSFYF